jgi:di/tricarboxylate transporter
VTAGAYIALGGWRLPAAASGRGADDGLRFERRHWLTVGVIAAWIAGVVGFKLSVGLAAFLAASILVLMAVADETAAMKRVPWGVIVMVCGVTVLIALLEKAEGIELISSFLARLSTKDSVTAVVAVITGGISVYSSTSGVVLPAFLPMVPSIAQQLGGANPVAIAMSMNVGGHLVDVSPLSTIGALCVAAVQADDSRRLFNQLLAWGLSMTIVGAVLCYLAFGRLRLV